MLRRFSVLALVLLLSSACSTAAMQPVDPPVVPGETWDYWETVEAAGFDAEGLDAVRASLDSLPSIGMMVVRGGRVAFEHGSLDTLSYIASVRKSILAMLYGTYVENGTIDLDQTLADLEMNDVQGLTEAEQQATIEHLITARSGVYHPASNPGDNLSDAPARGSQAPGSYFLYSNWDFNAAGTAFELATDLNIYNALQADLVEPLGFQDLNRFIHGKSGDYSRSRYPAYHMTFSTRDMARLGLLMLREGRWGDAQVIPQDWARWIVSLTTPIEDMNPTYLRDEWFGYGAMWWVYDGDAAEGAFEGAYSARGAYGQYITVLPKLDLVVAHKTLPGPFNNAEEYDAISVDWPEFQGLLDGLVAAYCGDTCGEN